MKHDPFRSDPRVCAPGEPKPEQNGPRVRNVQYVTEKRKRSFRDWVTGLQNTTGFGPGLSETDAKSFGKYVPASEWHFVPEVPSQDGKKGQPEGSAVTGKARKLRVAEMGLVFNEAAGQNNSNLTSLTTSVANGGWELILAMSSHYCFYTCPQILHISFIFYPLSFSPKGERLAPLLPPWGKVGKGGSSRSKN